ncbi:hypothetical protein Tco_0318391 [Tanacetum coccineum]
MSISGGGGWWIRDFQEHELCIISIREMFLLGVEYHLLGLESLVGHGGLLGSRSSVDMDESSVYEGERGLVHIWVVVGGEMVIIEVYTQTIWVCDWGGLGLSIGRSGVGGERHRGGCECLASLEDTEQGVSIATRRYHLVGEGWSERLGTKTSSLEGMCDSDGGWNICGVVIGMEGLEIVLRNRVRDFRVDLNLGLILKGCKYVKNVWVWKEGGVWWYEGDGLGRLWYGGCMGDRGVGSYLGFWDGGQYGLLS